LYQNYCTALEKGRYKIVSNKATQISRKKAKKDTKAKKTERTKEIKNSKLKKKQRQETLYFYQPVKHDYVIFLNPDNSLKTCTNETNLCMYLGIKGRLLVQTPLLII
jgi:hypothetical protein